MKEVRLTLEWAVSRLPESMARNLCEANGISYKEITDQLAEYETPYYPHEYEYRGIIEGEDLEH